MILCPFGEAIPCFTGQSQTKQMALRQEDQACDLMTSMGGIDGAGERDRTSDLLIANELL